MSRVSLADILSLSLADRIRYAQAIWDSIAAVPESVELTAVEREELDRRLEAYYRDPEAGSSWAEVRARVRKRAAG